MTSESMHVTSESGEWRNLPRHYLTGRWRHDAGMQEPGAVGIRRSDGSTRMDLLITSYDRSFVHRWWTSGVGWTDWQFELPGRRFVSRPALARSREDQLDAFTIDVSGNLYQARQRDAEGQWSLRNLGRPAGERFVSRPTAAVTPRWIRVIVRTTSGLWVRDVPRGEDTSRVGPRDWRRIESEGLNSRLSAWRYNPAAVYRARKPQSVAIFQAMRFPLPADLGELVGLVMVRLPVHGHTATYRRLPVNFDPRCFNLESGPEALSWPDGRMFVAHCIVTRPGGSGFMLRLYEQGPRGWGWRVQGSPSGGGIMVSDATLASHIDTLVDLFYVQNTGPIDFRRALPYSKLTVGHVMFDLATDPMSWTQDDFDFGDYPVEYLKFSTEFLEHEDPDSQRHAVRAARTGVPLRSRPAFDLFRDLPARHVSHRWGRGSTRPRPWAR